MVKIDVMGLEVNSLTQIWNFMSILLKMAGG